MIDKSIGQCEPAGVTEMVMAQGLRKTFATAGRTVEAIRGVDLRVEAGEVFAFLGPNGAGKTTTVRMLATLLPIDEGRALIAGADLRREPRRVRRLIGYVGQAGGADLPASGRENLQLQGRLYGMNREEVGRRIDELTEVLALGEFLDRRAATYSGGQRRRLEVALGLMHRPRLLFLDEPTTGLDPQNRANLWDQLRTLRDRGTTVFLTTHYLDEADALADRIAIMDGGRVVAEGTPSALKAQLDGDTVVVRPRPGPLSTGDLRALLCAQPSVRDVQAADGAFRLTVHEAAQALPRLLQTLSEHQVGVESLTMAEPSLDDVFLHTTGRALRDAGGSATAPEVAA